MFTYYVFRDNSPRHQFWSKSKSKCEEYIKNIISNWTPCHLSLSDYPRFMVTNSPEMPFEFSGSYRDTLRRKAGKHKNIVCKETAELLFSRGFTNADIEMFMRLQPRNGMNGWLLRKGHAVRVIGETSTEYHNRRRDPSRCPYFW